MEYAAEAWWTGRRIACTKLELAQMRVGRRLLGACNRESGVAVQGDLGWRKLEERRKEKVIFSKRLELLEESRLVKVVVNKLKEDRRIG